MKYISFTIENYKGIEEPLTLNIDKNPLIPIIGVNECGKTTILHAIFGFDFVNDSFNKNIRHLEDIKNRYETTPKDPKVSAEISITKEEIYKILKDLADENEPNYKVECDSYKRKLGAEYTGKVKITRNLITKRYNIDPSSKNIDFEDKLSDRCNLFL